MPAAEPTTAAPLTPPGRGAIGIIELRGPRCGAMLAEIFRGPSPARPGALCLGWLVEPDGTRLDQVLVLAETGRAEIHLHGGPGVERAALELLAAQGAEVRAARGGEGLPAEHPAWANPAIGRELLRALPDARTSLVVAAFAAQWSAGLSRLACEARTAARPPAELAAELRATAGRLPRMRRLLEPAEVVIAGPPNAGKSSLANALVERQVSVVHDRPGTTRDWVRETASFDGVPVELTDTAGLWATEDAIDAEAVARARHRAERADLVLLASPRAAAAVPEWLHASRVLRIATKSDLVPPGPDADVSVSTVTGDGLPALRLAAVSALGLDGLDPQAPAAFTQQQRLLLERAAAATEAGRTNEATAALDEMLGG